MKFLKWIKNLFVKPVELAWTSGENGLIQVYAIQRKGKNISLYEPKGRIVLTSITTENGDWSGKIE